MRGRSASPSACSPLVYFSVSQDAPCSRLSLSRHERAELVAHETLPSAPAYRSRAPSSRTCGPQIRSLRCPSWMLGTFSRAVELGTQQAADSPHGQRDLRRSACGPASERPLVAADTHAVPLVDPSRPPRAARSIRAARADCRACLPELSPISSRRPRTLGSLMAAIDVECASQSHAGFREALCRQVPRNPAATARLGRARPLFPDVLTIWCFIYARSPRRAA